MSYQLVGMGTYRLQNDVCTQIIKSGLELGYRQIDTAQLYHNHTNISQGISLSGVPREDIFIISKIHNSNIKKLKIAESIDNIKKELDTNYIDLILLHNPVKNYQEAWSELIRCKEHMGIKNIGVSNFNINDLENIIKQTNIPPYLNQIELNIFNQQKKLIEYHNGQKIITQSHTTLTKSNLLNDKDLVKYANELNYTPSELMYKFVLNQNIGILPRTSNQDHLISNYKLIENLSCKNIFNQTNIDKINKFDIGYKIY